MTVKQEKTDRKTTNGEKSIRFSKAKVLTMERYAKRRDLLSVLLTEERNYTIVEIEQMMEEFMKGKVM